VTQIATSGGPPARDTQNTILVVDDDNEMRECLRDILEDEGYGVVLASNGKVALGLLPSLRRPCGVILDIMMPVMGGPELYQAMRGAPDMADIPVVFLTADPAQTPAGMPTMQKTVGLDRLLGMVAALF
jgi:CheY-like chemotaxis protein